tara:strand:- start:433 stop:810 length:378 start_codon:yes stop_codon:yes gene_type:complete
MGYHFNIIVPVIEEGKSSYVNPDDPEDFVTDSHSFSTDSIASISKNSRSTSIRLVLNIYNSSIIDILVERKYCIDRETYRLLKEYIEDTYDKITYCMLLDSMQEKSNDPVLDLLKSVGILPPKKY